MSPHDLAERALTVAETLRSHADHAAYALSLRDLAESERSRGTTLRDGTKDAIAELAQIVATLAVEFANLAEPVS